MKKILALVLALAMVMALGMTALADGEIVSLMYGGGTPESMDPALNSASRHLRKPSIALPSSQ